MEFNNCELSGIFRLIFIQCKISWKRARRGFWVHINLRIDIHRPLIFAFLNNSHTFFCVLLKFMIIEGFIGEYFYSKIAKNSSLFQCRSLPKLSSHENDDDPDRKRVVSYFEPTPHDHSLCERVVINVKLHS